MDRLFESFGREIGWPTPEGRPAASAPSVDISETENELRIEADLPGVDQKDVNVVISDNVLTIKGEEKAEKEKKKDFHLVERSYGSFSRSLALPFAVDPNQAKATSKNGVLSISLPKAARGPGQVEEEHGQSRVIGPRPAAGSSSLWCTG